MLQSGPSVYKMMDNKEKKPKTLQALYFQEKA